MFAKIPERIMKTRPPSWFEAPCIPSSLLRLAGSGAKSKMSDVESGVIIPSPRPKRRRITRSNRKSLTKPPATPKTRKRLIPNSKSFFLSILAVRRAEKRPIGIITSVGRVRTSFAWVWLMPGNASQIAAKAGETAVGAIIVSSDTDRMDGISIREYPSIFIISFYTLPKSKGGYTSLSTKTSMRQGLPRLKASLKAGTKSSSRSTR